MLWVCECLRHKLRSHAFALRRSLSSDADDNAARSLIDHCCGAGCCFDALLFAVAASKLVHNHHACFPFFLSVSRDTTRVSVAAVTALTSLLMTIGLDVSSKAAPLHAAVWPFVKRAWQDARQAKLKVGLEQPRGCSLTKT